jgi:hypothetical protein
VELQGNDVASQKRQLPVELSRAKPSKQRKIQTKKPIHDQAATRRTTAAQRLAQTKLRTKAKSKFITPSPKNTWANTSESSRPEMHAAADRVSRPQTGYGLSVARDPNHATPAEQDYTRRQHVRESHPNNTSRDPPQVEYQQLTQEIDDHRSRNFFEPIMHMPAQATFQLGSPQVLSPQVRQASKSSVDQQQFCMTGTSADVYGSPGNAKYFARKIHADTSQASTAVWMKQRKEQERSQRRAFLRKDDNPFSSYKRDPNNSETYLDHLAAGNDEIIPLGDQMALDRMYNGQPNASSIRFHRHTAGPRNDTRKRAGITMTERDLLAHKSSESKFYSHSDAGWDKQDSQHNPVGVTNLSYTSQYYPWRQAVDGSTGQVKSGASLYARKPIYGAINAAEASMYWTYEETQNSVAVYDRNQQQETAWVAPPIFLAPHQMTDPSCHENDSLREGRQPWDNYARIIDSQTARTEFLAEDDAAFWN